METKGTERYLLQVNNLSKHFYLKNRFQKPKALKAVDRVSFSLQYGEALGLVGESGCGKTTLGRTVLRLYQPTSGSIIFEGRDMCRLTNREIRRLRGKMQIIFQDPFSSLNPRMTVGQMLRQILHCHGIEDRLEKKAKCNAVMESVGMGPAHLTRYPHEFSGGQRQRVAIARALILHPSFIVADEPSSALDMSIQAQLLNLMKSLQKKMGIAFLFITHNLAAARFICDRIAVMYLGKLVEIAPRAKIFGEPCHPYTRALLQLCPTPEPDSGIRGIPLAGEVPSPLDAPSGCPFHTRCNERSGICETLVPELLQLSDGHFVACHHA